MIQWYIYLFYTILERCLSCSALKTTFKHLRTRFTQNGVTIMFNRILVPLDGSMLAERAIPHAEQFARIFGSSIILLQVLDPTSYHENPNPVDPLSWQIRKAEADMYMNGIAAS
jgi:hypothetical protein